LAAAELSKLSGVEGAIVEKGLQPGSSIPFIRMEAKGITEAASIENLIALPSRKAAKAATDLSSGRWMEPVGDTGHVGVSAAWRRHRLRRFGSGVSIPLLSPCKGEAISMLLPNLPFRPTAATISAKEGMDLRAVSSCEKAEPTEAEAE